MALADDINKCGSPSHGIQRRLGAGGVISTATDIGKVDVTGIGHSAYPAGTVDPLRTRSERVPVLLLPLGDMS